MKTLVLNGKMKAFDRNAPLATPSASFSLRTFSNISSVDHWLILVDKTGLSFCFVSVISLVFFFMEVILFHLKSNSRKSLSTRNIFLLFFFFPQGFISSQLVSEANVSHFIERFKIFPRNQVFLRDVWMTRFLQEHSARTGPVWSDVIIALSCAIK